MASLQEEQRSLGKRKGSGLATLVDLHLTNSVNTAIDIKHGIERSVSDHRMYKSMVLENGLEALLVHDQWLEKCAAALSVSAGHLQDPHDIPGLAHLVEHLLLLGSRKCQDGLSLRKCLGSHGGKLNSFTSARETSFHFEVVNTAFECALHKFADMFLDPLFEGPGLEKELIAIDNEFELKVQDDNRRIFQIEKATCNPNHSFHKFGTGNFESLSMRDDLIDMSRAFFNHWYTPKRMKLVIIGSQEMEKLEKICQDLFTGIHNRGNELDRSKVEVPQSKFTKAYRPEFEYPVRIEIVPVQELHLMKLCWVIDGGIENDYYEGSHIYVMSMLEHRGKGTLASNLRMRGWVNSISARINISHADFAMLTLTLHCTEIGISEHENDIVDAVFEWINLIRDTGPMEWKYNEIGVQLANSFRFKANELPLPFAIEKAWRMHIYPRTYVLTGGALAREFNAERISELLDRLRVNLLRLIIVDKSVTNRAENVEKWYGVQYRTERLDTRSILRRTDFDKVVKPSELVFPSKNKYFPSEFSLEKFVPPEIIALSTNVPKMEEARYLQSSDGFRTINRKFVCDGGIMDSRIDCRWPGSRDIWRPPVPIFKSQRGNILWFKQDTTFQKPKLSVRVKLRTPRSNDSPRNLVIRTLFIDLIETGFLDYTFGPNNAGLGFLFLGDQSTGLEFAISGFTENIERFLKGVILRMTSPEELFDELEFGRRKEVLMRSFENWSQSQPMAQAKYNIEYLLKREAWSMTDCYEALPEITFSHVLEWIFNVFQENRLEVLVHGNVTPERAKLLFDILESDLSIGNPPLERSSRQVIRLPKQTQTYYLVPGLNPNNSNSAVTVLFQFGVRNDIGFALLTLLKHTISEPFFDEIRTQEQLGYFVKTEIIELHDTLGMCFVVQSNTMDPLSLDQRIEAFLNEFGQFLETMSEEDFENILDSVLNDLLVTDRGLWSEADRWWKEISRGTYDFDARLGVAAAVAEMKVEDLTAFHKVYLDKRAILRRKLVSGVFADRGHSLPLLNEDEKTNIISSPAKFRETNAEKFNYFSEYRLHHQVCTLD